MSATGDVSRQMRADAGATLLEMIVVVAILALTAGLTFPNLRRPYDMLSAEASRAAVVADLRSARAQAIRTGRAVAFEVGQDGREYSVGPRDIRLPDAVRLRAEPRSILFAPDGGADGARLILSRRNGRSLGVIISPGLGVVQSGAAM